MSDTYTPDSAPSTPSSSHSSGRRLDSDTTPSPSGGNLSPPFNPRVLSNKLAMLEASRALAQASSTLSIAARAMSKAAASIAAATDYSDEDYDFETQSFVHVKDWVQSPDWTQKSYNLLPVPTTSEDKGIYAIDEGFKHANTGEITPVEETVESQQEHASGSESHGPAPMSLTETQPSVPQVVVTRVLPVVSSNQPTSSIPGDAVSPVVKPTFPAVRAGSEANLAPGNNVATGSKPSPSKTVSTAPAPAPAPIPNIPHVPTKGSSSSNKSSGQPTSTNTNAKQNPSQASPGKTGRLPSSTRIILERGFDLLPALCHVTKRCAKTVCIYNYSGLTAIISIAVMLKVNVNLPVVKPASTKSDKLAVAVNEFNSAQSGVLLWPGCNTLPKTIKLDSPDIQLIQLGRSIQAGFSNVCPKMTVILARSDLVQPQAAQNNDYSVDPLNDVCNQQGPKSLLQPFRVWLRSRLSDDSYARGFYWDWYLQYRKRNPKQSAMDTLKLANQYAEQFLLRGDSQKYGEPIGGKITLTEGTVKDQQLEAAVQMGILLVARA